MRVRVKICGITNREDALAAVAVGADALGFVFAPSLRQIAPAAAAEIIAELPPFVTTVGVLVNQDVHAILRVCPLDAIQFHGHESPEDLAAARGVRRIKAFRVHRFTEEFAELEQRVREERWDDALGRDRRQAQVDMLIRQLVDEIRPFQGIAHAYLLDTYVEGQEGGTGQVFPWAIAAGIGQAGQPVILAGGLKPENVAAAIRLARPHGVDVSSGVEREPGRKDSGKMRTFASQVAQANMASGHEDDVVEKTRHLRELQEQLRALRTRLPERE